VTYVNGSPVKGYPTYAPESERGRVLRVTEIGEPVLHAQAETVTKFDTAELRTLVDDMFATMDGAEGVGLAAPQIGVPLRVFVYDLVDDDDVRHVGAVVNPVLVIDEDAGMVGRDEGCLSVPGAYMPLDREGAVTLTGQDIVGRPLELKAVGYLARCFLHETGHTQGTLYFDLLSDEAKVEALRQRDTNRADVIARRAEVARALGKEPAKYPSEPAGGR
jgi:peptide deformylase